MMVYYTIVIIQKNHFHTNAFIAQSIKSKLRKTCNPKEFFTNIWAKFPSSQILSFSISWILFYKAFSILIVYLCLRIATMWKWILCVKLVFKKLTKKLSLLKELNLKKFNSLIFYLFAGIKKVSNYKSKSFPAFVLASPAIVRRQSCGLTQFTQ